MKDFALEFLQTWNRGNFSLRQLTRGHAKYITAMLDFLAGV